MATEANQPFKITLRCSTDLAALYATSQYTFVKIAQTTSASHYTEGEAVPALTGDFPIGVLQNNPKSQGLQCEVVVIGVTKVKCIGTIPLGAAVTVTTSSSLGKAAPGTITGSTYTKPVVGIAYPASNMSSDWVTGDMATVMVNCLPGFNAGT